MAEILVTGGAGYVGSVCGAELIRQGHKVVVVDDLSSGHKSAAPKNAEFHAFDIADDRKLTQLVQSHRFDAVFHFAARALIPESVTNPAPFFKINVTSALSMLDVIRKAGVRNFVFSSTAAVYGNPIAVPITEDHPKDPVNAYGESKLCFERALDWYARAYDMTAVAFRYFNASGATEEHGELHEPETHIIPLLLEVASGKREVFTIYGDDYETPDGTCLRDYVHVRDIAQAHILAIDSSHSGLKFYNIGTGQSFSVRAVKDAVERVAGKTIRTRIGPRRLGDPAILQACPERLKSELGWTPSNSDLENIIRSAWMWNNRAMSEHAA